MLSKIICTILLLAFFLKSELNAQSRFLEYYKNINLAELAICDSNFTAACDYYKNAFAVNPEKPFSKDLLNAFFAAMDTKQYSLAEKNLSALLSRGLGSRFINHKILKYYTGEQLAHIHTILKKYPNDTLGERPLADTIHKMLQWDRDVRMYYAELNDGAYMTDSTYTVDSVNAMRLLKLFKKYGVPNEVVLGNSKWDDFSVKYAPDYDIIITHHNGGAFGGRPSHLMDTLLYKAVLKFDFEAHCFADLINGNPLSDTVRLGNTSLLLPIMIKGAYYDKKIYPEYFDEASEKRMNEQRVKIGLESLDDFRKKIESKNRAINDYSVLHKYFFSWNIMVLDQEDEASLRKWLAVNGKDAVTKKSIFHSKKTIAAIRERFDYGNVGNRYVIGRSTFDSFIHEYKYHWNKEYYQGQIPFHNWKKGKPSLPWNYHAEVIDDPNTNLTTDTGRANRARFVPGFKMLVEDSYNFMSIGYFSNIWLSFDKDTLMRFSASVNADFYKVVTRRIAPPDTVLTSRDTVACSYGKLQNSILTQRTYQWKKGRVKMEIVTKEALNDKCVKQTSATFTMTDEKKYKTYLQKVAAEKKRLDKLYK